MWSLDFNIKRQMERGYHVAMAPTVANTKTGWYELHSSLPEDASYFIWGNSYRQYYRYLVDIGIGAIGSEEVIAENIMCGQHENSYGYHVPEYFHIPIPVKAGTRISSRCQVSSVSASANMGSNLMWGVAGGFDDASKYVGISKCITLGAVTGSTNGTSVDPGGVANTYGSWVQFTSGLDYNLRGLSFRVGPYDTDIGVSANWLMQIGIGGSGVEEPIVDYFYVRQAASSKRHAENNIIPMFPFQIPASTRIAVRARCSMTDSTDRIGKVTLHGWY